MCEIGVRTGGTADLVFQHGPHLTGHASIGGHVCDAQGLERASGLHQFEIQEVDPSQFQQQLRIPVAVHGLVRHQLHVCPLPDLTKGEPVVRQGRLLQPGQAPLHLSCERHRLVNRDEPLIGVRNQPGMAW